MALSRFCVSNNAACLCCSTVAPSRTQYSKARMYSLRNLTVRTKTAQKVALKQLLLLHSCLIGYARQNQIQSLFIIWLRAMWSCSYFTMDRQKSGDGVCNASAVLGCSDSARAIIWAVILYICTLDFIAKWSLLSWNSFESRQIYHQLSQTQTAAWKWGAKQMHFMLRESTRALLFFSLQKWGAAAGRSQPRGMEISLRNGSYIEAHNNWYSLLRILTTYISHFSVTVGNRACALPLDGYFVNKTSQPLNPQKENNKFDCFYCIVLNGKATCSLWVCFFVCEKVVDSSISGCLPFVPLQRLHFTQ